ncbi:uncharacterized protein LOC131664963 [Phymastichus coffea]|uniref:uncharacterized protein LOC131664963 n=1 Tax=Phymastichus coffea TaxID=108790 RepID=UPI00273BED10|nr:uncharacterized protein LOC131664963 [Phymastichus coffea]
MQSLVQTMRILMLTQAILFILLGLSRAEGIATNNGSALRKIVYEMDIDNLIDENIERIREVVSELDPIKLDNVKFPVTSSIYMLLYDGWAQNLAELQRAGKCKIRYSNKKLDIDLNLGWDNLVFDYQYLIKMLLLKREGDLHGQMTKLNMHINMRVDFNNYQITLNELDLVENGNISLTLVGHRLDYIYNLAIKAAIRAFRDSFLNTIRKEIEWMILYRISKLNIKLNSIIHRSQFTFVDSSKNLP